LDQQNIADRPYRQKIQKSAFSYLEAISKKGFWFKIAAEPSFKPQEYIRISRI